MCDLCSGSGWILPPFQGEHICSPVAMRCTCLGGYEALARHYETREHHPDKGLAKRLRATWSKVSAWEYKTGGFRFPCKCELEEVPF